MRATRRDALTTTGVMLAGLAGLNLFDREPIYADGDGFGYGPLKEDPENIIDLPHGFSYHLFSQTGEWMDDDLRVPGAHDGMATFPGPRGTTLLVRNHELSPVEIEASSLRGDSHLLSRLPKEKFYDLGQGKRPAAGGTTTLVYDTRKRELTRHFTSLVGTTRNCSGGPTPWRSWLTCEETVDRKADLVEQDHGYIFEVPATARPELAEPIAYKAMGRFNHEAVAVDSRTGIVYLTEDREDGLLYRFLPVRPGRLGEGGKLQCLVLGGDLGTNTRNWPEEGWFPVHQTVAVKWIDVENVESPDDDLRQQGGSKGAARFARGEGIWYDSGTVYFACTNGGPNKKGQIFRYVPSEQEGQAGENKNPGSLTLFCQPNDSGLLQMADNLAVAPWGDVIICEDGDPVNHLVGVTAKGKLYRFARNKMNDSEFAGSCFSPDGTTLFVNIQTPGMTLAITGPWHLLERNDQPQPPSA